MMTRWSWLLVGIFVLTGVAHTSAADLDWRNGYTRPHQPPYYGLHEPWSRQSERPPRKGEWFYTGPMPPAVNFLVPMGKRHLYQKPTPWTPAWYAYCAKRWPSFNPRTGTIRTPDGVRMCM
ncbi:MAG: BA14K family protein [Pseudomonadota bacterium]